MNTAQEDPAVVCTCKKPQLTSLPAVLLARDKEPQALKDMPMMKACRCLNCGCPIFLYSVVRSVQGTSGVPFVHS